MIVAGEILPGEAITLRDLSYQFKVSMVPVREALFQLEGERVIVRRNNRDYRVNTLTASQFEELYRIRRMLEPRLCEQACLRRSDSCLVELRRILKRMRASCKDAKRYIFNNHEFHARIYSEAAMPMLFEIVNGLWARLGPSLSINLKPIDASRTISFHEDMLCALASKDTKAFRKALASDMDYSHHYLQPFMRV